MAAKQPLALWLRKLTCALVALCTFSSLEARADWQPAASDRAPIIFTPNRERDPGWLAPQMQQPPAPRFAEQMRVHTADLQTTDLGVEPLINLDTNKDNLSLPVRLASWLDPQGYRPQRVNDGRGCPWTWQLLPNGLIYKSYLAGEREPRFASAWLYEKDRGTVWDIALGGRVGIFRYGTPGTFRPQGWQLDFEGAVFPRIDPDEHHDLEASDYRVGVPLTWSRGSIAIKAGYFHISSHVGDEFLLRNPGFNRINYVRDSLVFGIAHFPSDDTRVYFEIGYAPGVSGGAKPLEFQFGAEYSPVGTVCCNGAPFAAINGHIREEVDFGGSVNIQAGWQWRGPTSNRVMRLGLQYFNGKSYVYEFFDTHEALTGLGLWLDY